MDFDELWSTDAHAAEPELAPGEESEETTAPRKTRQSTAPGPGVLVRRLPR